MRLNVDYKDLDDLLEKYQDALPPDEKLTRIDVKIFENIFFGLAEISNGGWISVKDRLPEEGVRVLAVKKLKDGRRDLALATCIPEYKHHDYVTGEDIVEPYWVCGGNNNITHWMPLPGIPEEESHGNTET